MGKFKNAIFYIALTVSFIYQGLGIQNGKEIVIFTSFVAFLFLLISNLKELKKIDKGLLNLIALFIFLSIISTLFSKNIPNSIEQFIVYLNIFMAFCYVVTEKEKIKKGLIFFIVGAGLLFCFYSLLINFFAEKNIFIGQFDGYQLVFPKFGSHNHLGDFLILPIIIGFYSLVKKIGNSFFVLLTTIVFVPYFLFSYSRSAYLDLILVLSVMIFSFINNKKTKINPVIMSLIILTVAVSIVFLTSVAPANQNKLINIINKDLAKTNSLNLYRSPSGNRIEYTNQAFLSIIDSPLVGVGPGNFIFASKKLASKPWLYSETTHNIFLDIMAENGVIAGIMFIIIVLKLLFRSEKNLYFFLALALLLNFQTDYTYRIYAVLLLCFVLLGINYTKEGTSIDSKVHRHRARI